MKSGFIPKGKVSDETIAGSKRDPRKQALPPEDFAEGTGEEQEGEPEIAEVAG